MGFSALSYEEEQLGKAVVQAAFKVHKVLGAGHLEKIYELCLVHELRKMGKFVERQKEIPIRYDGIIFKETLRLDILIEKKVIVEVKSVETLNPVWRSQVISQLKFTGLRLGYVINFNVPLIKDGIIRIIK